MVNLYWPIYKNLENELLSLTYNIFFTDGQLNVYSMNFVDLLLRTSAEIESIAKELYEQEGGNMNPVDEEGNSRCLYFDTDCIEYLNEKWSICGKKISITAATVHFEQEENITISPLLNANKRGKNIWKKAYQSVKHSRKKSFKDASLKNCIYALGALYILNIYLLNEELYRSQDSYPSNFFSPKTDFVPLPDIKADYDYTKYTDCIFLNIFDEKDYKTYFRYRQEEFETLKRMLISSTEYNSYLAKNPNANFTGMDIFYIYKLVGGIEFARNMFDKVPHRADIMVINAKTKRVLNKNQIIYNLEEP
ncbi:MAG: hypothetical protein K2H24_04745 [Clostridia bacterium]|nr:hypothetical protein [Clostridia bacterium]